MTITPAPISDPNAAWINPLLSGVSWSGNNIGIAPTVLFNLNSEIEAGLDVGIRLALEEWSNVSGVTFLEIVSPLGITFGRDTLPTILGGVTKETKFGDDSFLAITTVDISNILLPVGSSFAKGSLGFQVLLHEIGHALGLAHPDQAGASPFAGPFAAAFQNNDYTQMISAAATGGPITTVLGASFTPQYADILAIQYLYGPKQSSNPGDDVYNFLTTGEVSTILDTGGTDLVDSSAYLAAATINLNEGGDAFSLVNGTAFWFASGSNIENADGGKVGDTITGNSLDNILRGFNGNDSVSGGAGVDFINGNKNNDTVAGGQGNDKVLGGQDSDIVNGNDGDDWVNGNNGRDNVSGDVGNDTVHGGKDDDFLSAGDGNDIVNGDLGNDTLNGGAGADTFVFNASSGVDIIDDFVIGTDKIQIASSVIATTAQAVAAFSGGVLTLSATDSVTLTGITSVTESDFVIV